jgi:hypothetical protein
VATEDLDQYKTSKVLSAYEITGKQLMLYLSALPPSGTQTFKYHLQATMPITASDGGAEVYLYYQPKQRSAGAFIGSRISTISSGGRSCRTPSTTLRSLVASACAVATLPDAANNNGPVVQDQGMPGRQFVGPRIGAHGQVIHAPQPCAVAQVEEVLCRQKPVVGLLADLLEGGHGAGGRAALQEATSLRLGGGEGGR